MLDIPLKNLELHDLNPLFCGWENCSASHFYGPAIRDCYLIHFIRSGAGIFERLDTQQKITLKAGCMFLIHPGERTYYQANTKSPWQYTWVGFNGHTADTLLNTIGFSKKNPVLYAPQAAPTFFEMVQRIPEGGQREFHVLSKLYQLFSLLANSDTPAPGQKISEVYVRRAEDYIKAQYARHISIAGLADFLKIDRRYLSRIFTQYTGISPQNYLVNYRLYKAATLLRSTSLSIVDIARSVGYDDPFYFSNLFKKNYGKSPTQFRLDPNTFKGGTL